MRVAELIERAEANGFTVNRDGNRLDITKARGRRITRGVAVYLTETGAFYQAHRIDIPLDITTTLRTVTQVAQVLGVAR